uniref:NADH-ubiquinone oxidoreductase chain 6 n=1 Tax=Symphurus plagiusa TaxID=637534 RepID=W5QKH9_9PLEU|nr:NADH dehydrogenase subunit 6 [Symphurus plagiusa]
MWMTLYLIIFLFLIGVVAVASNPSPFFAALGLVVVAVTGCWMIISHGGTFLSVVVLLIYLGGMLVVFAYACSFSAENYPEGWGTGGSGALIIFYGLLLGVGVLGGVPLHEGLSWAVSEEADSFEGCRGDFAGVAQLYGGGGFMLVIGAWALLLTLFVVMEISRGGSRGVLRV